MSLPNPAPYQAHLLLQIRPLATDSVAQQLAKVKNIKLDSEQGVSVEVQYIPSSSTLKGIVSFELEKGNLNIDRLTTKLFRSYQEVANRVTKAEEIDLDNKRTRYTISREFGADRPREVFFDIANGQVLVSMVLYNEIPELKSNIANPQNLISFFQILSRELHILSGSLSSQGARLPFSKQCFLNLSDSLVAGYLPAPEAEEKFTPVDHGLDDVVGQRHVVTRLREGLHRLERFLNPEIPEYLDPAIQARIRYLTQLITIPTGYVFKGPSGVGKNYSADAFINELKSIVTASDPEANLLVESISPTIIRDSLWGQDEENVSELFQRLRKSVKENKVAVLFIDEADTLLADSADGGHQSAVTNQFKIELNDSQGIIVILSTNNPDTIDRSILNRVGLGNILEFNFLDGNDIVNLVQRRFKTHQHAFLGDAHSINFELLRGDKSISLLKDKTGREVKQMLDGLFTLLANQEIYRLTGVPKHEIPGYVNVNTDYLKSKILNLSDG